MREILLSKGKTKPRNSNLWEHQRNDTRVIIRSLIQDLISQVIMERTNDVAMTMMDFDGKDDLMEDFTNDKHPRKQNKHKQLL